MVLSNNTVILSGRPNITRWYYCPGRAVHNWDFVKGNGIGLRTKSGYFIKFHRPVQTRDMTVRTLCPVPLTRKRFSRLLSRAMQYNSDDENTDDDEFVPLKIKDTTHYISLQAARNHV